METNLVYFDHNATTPVDPEVIETMLPYFQSAYGNASSSAHAFGWIASEAVQIAREQVASLIGSETNEIIFTSGATESLNQAIQSIALNYQSKGKHLISFQTEHKAVLEPLTYLESLGWEVEILTVKPNGQTDLDCVKKAIRNDTVLIAAMLANNETGVIWPMREISELAREKGAFVLCDATQGCGKIPVNVNDLGVDLLSLSAHKFYGPKGVGAFYVRRKNPRVTMLPLIRGGGHERGLRSGTLNVPGIVGMGKAAELAQRDLVKNELSISRLRDLLEFEIKSQTGAQIVCEDQWRLPNTSLFRIPEIKSSAIISGLPSFAFSTGSACSSALPEPSHVLRSLGYSEKQAYETVRLSLGKYNQESEILGFVKQLKESIL